MLPFRPCPFTCSFRALPVGCLAFVIAAFLIGCGTPALITKEYDQRIRMSKPEAVAFLKSYLRNEQNLSVDDRHLAFTYTRMVNTTKNVYGSLAATNIYREELFLVNITYDKVVKMWKGRGPGLVKKREAQANGMPGEVVYGGTAESLHVFDGQGVDLSGGFGWRTIDDSFISALLALCPNIETTAQGADPSDKIYEAISQGDPTQLSAILQGHPEYLDFKTDYGTPLYIAAENGNMDAAKLLLEKGAKINEKTRKVNGDFTALYAAAANDHRAVLELLIAKGADINLKTGKGYTPLHIAAYENHTDVVGVLIAKGADVNVRSNNGMTPLASAAEACSLETAERLITAGAEIDARDQYGFCPLHTAAMNGCQDFSAFLIEKGTAADAKSDSGYTPLYYAAQNDHRDVAALLIRHGAEVNHKAKNGWTPLHIAVSEGKKAMADFLLKNGADINAKNADGATPLHLAVGKANLELVALLIDGHADINAKNNLGWTPLHIATTDNQWDLANLLREKGGVE